MSASDQAYGRRMLARKAAHAAFDAERWLRALRPLTARSALVRVDPPTARAICAHYACRMSMRNDSQMLDSGALRTLW